MDAGSAKVTENDSSAGNSTRRRDSASPTESYARYPPMQGSPQKCNVPGPLPPHLEAADPNEEY